MPPQWRDPRILLLPSSHPSPPAVISTEGGAFAAAVERPPHFAFALAFPRFLFNTGAAMSRKIEQAYVYILASSFQRLYIGITTRIEVRMRQHKNGSFPSSFTSKYRIDKLVHLERYALVTTAIAREKQLKRWSRIKKIRLIVAHNPTWKDLSEDWGKPIPPYCEPAKEESKG